MLFRSLGVLRFGQRLVVPKDMELRNLILREAHDSPLSIHPGATKMYQDLRQRFWWTRMKREIAKFVAECDVCRRVKAEHQRPAGLLQPLPIPEWKWDSIGMDFITGLPTSPKKKDAIWVVIDRLTKVAHFLPVNIAFNASLLADLYISRIVCLHGVPKTIVSDRGPQFTSSRTKPRKVPCRDWPENCCYRRTRRVANTSPNSFHRKEHKHGACLPRLD